MTLALNVIHQGPASELAKRLDDRSVHCIVTSPPYWGLRDYKAEGQWGLEKTPEEYVSHLVGVFRELRRSLRDDGTVWLNLGDSYAGGGNGGGGSFAKDGIRCAEPGTDKNEAIRRGKRGVEGPLKPKDLVGIPWRIAFALQADGWWLRSDIIWSKPNPMPESVTDRPTRSHEYLFLLTKSQRYYYDAEAVKEACAQPDRIRADKIGGNKGDCTHHSPGAVFKQDGIGARRYTGFNGRWDASPTPSRNLRSVWQLATVPYPGSHYAVFPPELPRRCIAAGTSERGCCPQCGAGWVRILEKKTNTALRNLAGKNNDEYQRGRVTSRRSPVGDFHDLGTLSSVTVGWAPSCKCYPSPSAQSVDKTLPCLVLDPFAGSGTTGVVALMMGRSFIGFDIAGGDCDHGGFTPNDRLRAAAQGKELNLRWLKENRDEHPLFTAEARSLSPTADVTSEIDRKSAESVDKRLEVPA